MRVGRKKISTSCLIVSKYVMIVKKKKKKTRYNRYLFPLFVSSNRYEPARQFFIL